MLLFSPPPVMQLFHVACPFFHFFLQPYVCCFLSRFQFSFDGLWMIPSWYWYLSFASTLHVPPSLSSFPILSTNLPTFVHIMRNKLRFPLCAFYIVWYLYPTQFSHRYHIELSVHIGVIFHVPLFLDFYLIVVSNWACLLTKASSNNSLHIPTI